MLKTIRESGQRRDDCDGHVGAIRHWDRYTDSLAYSPSQGLSEDLDSVSMQVLQELARDQAEGNVTGGVFTPDVAGRTVSAPAALLLLYRK